MSQQIASLERIVGARVIEREQGRQALGPTEIGPEVIINSTNQGSTWNVQNWTVRAA